MKINDDVLERLLDRKPEGKSGKKAKDLLRHDQVAKKVTEAIDLSERIDVSPCIAIFGPWGTGKTNILNLIERELKAKKTKKYVWHYIDAWHNQQDNLIVLELLRGLISKCNGNMKATLLKLLWAVAGSAASALVKSVIPGDMGEELTEAFKEGFSDEFPSSREQVIKDEFRKIVDDLTQNGKHRLVIAVDNLDRCRPEAALRMLESLFLLTDVQNCAYLVAADQQVLVSFLDREYRGTAFNGTKYLEKIFPYYFRVPDPWVAWEYYNARSEQDEVLKFLSHVVPHDSPWYADVEIRELLWYFCSQSRALRNPRRIKRLLFRLLTHPKQPKNEADAEPLLFLVILSDLWPDAYEFLLSTDPALWLRWLNYMATLEGAKPLVGVHLEDQELQDFIRQIWIYEEKSFEDSDIGNQESLWDTLDEIAELGL